MAVYMPFTLSTNYYAAWCFFVMLFRCIGEVLLSVLLAPCRSSKPEEPEVTYIATPFNKALVAGCPSIHSFRPAWWARGPHAQTMAMAITAHPESQYRREMVTMPTDGVQVALDWKEDSKTVTATSPLVLCLHGMGGCSESQYVRVFADRAMRRGYRAVVYNRRGHGGTSLLPVLPEGKPQQEPNLKEIKIFPKHSNMDDMMAVVQHLCTLHPHAPKYLIGFSCGANLAINYLAAVAAAEESCPFIATASVSNGYDIWQGTRLLSEEDTIGSGVGAQFLKGMLLAGRLEEAKQLAAQAGIKIDFDAVMKSRSVQELETLLVVPAYGYHSLEEYYNDDSCHRQIRSVQSPLLCICAQKDPLVMESLLDVPRSAAKANQNIVTIISNEGGHCGWIIDLKQDPWYLTLYFEYIERVAALKGYRQGKDAAAAAGGTDGESVAVTVQCQVGAAAAACSGCCDASCSLCRPSAVNVAGSSPSKGRAELTGSCEAPARQQQAPVRSQERDSQEHIALELHDLETHPLCADLAV